MIRLQSLKYGSLFLGILLMLSSCSKDDEGGHLVTGGTDGIKVTLSTRPAQTKANITPGDGVIADGGGIYMSGSAGSEVPDLCILIFNSSGNLTGYYPNNGASGDNKPTHRIVNQTATSALEIEVTFKKPAVGDSWDDGDYNVYALANTEGMWKMKKDDSVNAYDYATWNDVFTALKGGTLSEADFKTLKFQDLATSFTPQIEQDRLPLSAIAEMAVASHTGRVSAEMLRCLCKISVTMENLTGEDIIIDGFTIDAINASTGYLIKQEAEEGQDTAIDIDVPSSATYTTLEILEEGDPTDDITIGTEEEDEDDPDYHIQKILTDTYLFPNANIDHYLINLRFGGSLGATTYSEGEVLGNVRPDPDTEYYIKFTSGTKPGYVFYNSSSTGTMLRIDSDATDVPVGAEYRWKILSTAADSWRYDIQNVGSSMYIMASGDPGTYYQRQAGSVNERGYAYEIQGVSTKPSLHSEPISWTKLNNGMAHNTPATMTALEAPRTPQYPALTRGKSINYASSTGGNDEEFDVYAHTGWSGNLDHIIEIVEAIEHVHGDIQNLPIRNKYNQNITHVDRNQDLQIHIKVSRTSSFAYELEAWTEKTESIHFD